MYLLSWKNIKVASIQCFQTVTKNKCRLFITKNKCFSSWFSEFLCLKLVNFLYAWVELISHHETLSACGTSLPHTWLHKFTTLMIYFPILITWSPLKKKLKHLCDTPAHNHAPPYKVRLQKIKWFRRYFLDNNVYVKTS